MLYNQSATSLAFRIVAFTLAHSDCCYLIVSLQGMGSVQTQYTCVSIWLGSCRWHLQAAGSRVHPHGSAICGGLLCGTKGSTEVAHLAKVL